MGKIGRRHCETQGLALVPDYRVYTLGEDGHIFRRTEISCPDDQAALERAKNIADGHAVELWKAPAASR